MVEAIWIGFAFFMGLAVKQTGLPPLIGYLAAGFLISQLGGFIDMPENSNDVLNHLAHLGVLLLLFTVGLKLNVKKVMKSEVIGTSVLHFIISIIIFAPVIYWISDVTATVAAFLAIALSFSSTVLAAKSLESKSELKAFHGRIAISILIIQDIIALVVMSLASGEVPSVWALGIFLLPFTRPFLYKILDQSGHDELLLLFGLVLALIVGGSGFEAVGLSSELGALVFGALLAGHERASELSKSLWGLKEAFLVAFFLTIGLKGLPDMNAWIFAVTVTLLLPLQGMVFHLLLTGFKLKSRTAFLTSASLTNFSEFGLIVAAVLMPEWTVPLALAVALSFLFSAPLNRYAHPIFDKFEPWLNKLERNVRHPDEEPISLGEATILIIGMGRVGRPSYDKIIEDNPSEKIIGFDSDQERIDNLNEKGYVTEFADAEHGNFWGSLDLTQLKYCVLSMNNAEASKIAATQLRKYGYTGYIVAHTMYKDEADAIERAGADKTYLTLTEAGEGLAGHVIEQINRNKVLA
jgi:predicted Kef-type K+ transport protein